MWNKSNTNGGKLMVEPEVYNAIEAARILKISVRTLYKLVKDGKLIARRINENSGKYLILKTSIEKFLNGE